MSVFLTPELQPFLGGAVNQHESHASCLKISKCTEGCYSLRETRTVASDEHVHDRKGGCPYRHVLPAH